MSLMHLAGNEWYAVCPRNRWFDPPLTAHGKVFPPTPSMSATNHTRSYKPPQRPASDDPIRPTPAPAQAHARACAAEAARLAQQEPAPPRLAEGSVVAVGQAPPPCVFASPLTRAGQTAEALAEAMGLPIRCVKV